MFWEQTRRLSRPGPTASHVLLTEACVNYYISFCYLSAWFITGRQSGFKGSTMLRGPPDALRERERERIPALSPERDGGGWTKTHCPWILKRRLMAAMKKKGKKRNVL